MRILMTSFSYGPAVGGLETVSRLVAEGLRERGQNLTLITQTPAAGSQGWVVRHPPTWRAGWLMRQADVVLQSNISLRWLWIALLLRKPVVVVNHTWIRRPDGNMGWQDYLKRLALRLVQVTGAVSTVLAQTIGPKCRVVPNPYENNVFRLTLQDGNSPRTGLLFLGRLVSDKGCDLALVTLAALRKKGANLHLTVIGTGPEEDSLAAQAIQLGIERYVAFKGVLKGSALVEEMNRHRVLMATSKWDEPFGLVVLEGLACGLTPVVPNRGGLPGAAGKFGCIYEHGNVESLVQATQRALDLRMDEAPLKDEVAAHLKQHYTGNVITAYEVLLQSAINRR